jgi:uroporphyrin-III C-methyltransferase/precorrin-2 dehydrogenase/sirohydrochlorin ferrochelatase
MRFLPVCLDLHAGVVTLVGSSAPAHNKLRLLRAAGAQVRWFPLAGCAAEETGGDPAVAGSSIKVTYDDPLTADLSESIAVVCAAGRPLDDKLAAKARAQRIPVNVVDRADLSTFIFPAIVDRGEVVVAIGTGGASPVLARRLRERIEALLPARLGDLAALMGRYRSRVAAIKSGLSPRVFWQRIIDGPIADAALGGRIEEAEAALDRAVDLAVRGGAKDEAGTVFLVGAGPGDPDLLTLRALQVLQDADVVFYDELVTAGVLERARRDCERIFVGKRRGAPGIGQNEINRRLLEAAQSGRRVVRLKGGDPFVFGRGGEELEFLRANDVPVVVVPGITAALGCAAEAGLPLTLRGAASRVTFVTAQQAAFAKSIDWTGLAASGTTVVVYMGLAAAKSVRDGLIGAGHSPSTPLAILVRGTHPDSRSSVGRLDELPELAAAVGDGPALLVVGEVVAHSTPWLVAKAARAREAVRDAA